MSIEKRKYKRANSIISGEFYSQADNKSGGLMVLDSSRGGFKAAFDKAIFPGGLLRFQIQLPGKKMPIFTTGVVTWLQERGQNRIYNFNAGIELLEIDSIHEQKISEYDLGHWHIRQIADYALHKGYFARRLSHKPFEMLTYLPIQILAVIVLGAIASVVFHGLALFYFAALLLYMALIALFTLITLFWQRSRKSFAEILKLVLPVSVARISSHIAYGLFFVFGIFKQRL
ncbi:MAG: PilZ domain-containing protein [Candidatus Omnitrophica bacterium]|nr:PilZ domain-containing protein [Candidatus Omnitrophota bacterium]